MSIAEDSGLAGSVQPIRVDQRVLGRQNDLDVLKTGLTKMIRYKLGSILNILVMLGEGGHTGDAQELFQLFKQAIFMLLDIGSRGDGGCGRGE